MRNNDGMLTISLLRCPGGRAGYYSAFYTLGKKEYNGVHPYTSWIPITLYIGPSAALTLFIACQQSQEGARPQHIASTALCFLTADSFQRVNMLPSCLLHTAFALRFHCLRGQDTAFAVCLRCLCAEEASRCIQLMLRDWMQETSAQPRRWHAGRLSRLIISLVRNA